VFPFAGAAEAAPAGAAGVKQKAAAMPAMVGAAAAVTPEGSLTRDCLEWRPKGLLSAKCAPTGIPRTHPDGGGLLEAPVSSRLGAILMAVG
jgi:hypothetical protein